MVSSIRASPSFQAALLVLLISTSRQEVAEQDLKHEDLISPHAIERLTHEGEKINIDAHAVAILGVDPANRDRYVGIRTLTCNVSETQTITIDSDRINDDYCDCLDGSDEPGQCYELSMGVWKPYWMVWFCIYQALLLAREFRHCQSRSSSVETSEGARIKHLGQHRDLFLTNAYGFGLLPLISASFRMRAILNRADDFCPLRVCRAATRAPLVARSSPPRRSLPCRSASRQPIAPHASAPHARPPTPPAARAAASRRGWRRRG